MADETMLEPFVLPGIDAISRIALVGNFLPRLCGIATFTTHVYNAMRARFPDIATDVYAMNDRGAAYDYPAAVTMAIPQDDIPSYDAAADLIAARGSDLVWVQHEFGIFGGPAGENLLVLLDAVALPVIVTFHTVLTEPNDDQRRVMERLLKRASLVMVMAARADTRLRQTYGDIVGKVAVVPSGIPDRAYEEPAHARQRLGFAERPTIMTFGLLSPDKGIETMIRAMPSIVVRVPDALYRIVGATHPHLVAQEGEAHRERLITLARALGVEGHLQWDNRFLDEDELLDQIAAADIYVTPYRNPAQITSGTLAYAAGLGKPIVATPYVHAQELLADGKGCLVGFDDAVAMGAVIGDLLTDAARRTAMAGRIYRESRGALWENMVAAVLA
jgi:glycosyltransferase involved in cell wall biosynthesis